MIWFLFVQVTFDGFTGSMNFVKMFMGFVDAFVCFGSSFEELCVILWAVFCLLELFFVAHVLCHSLV